MKQLLTTALTLTLSASVFALQTDSAQPIAVHADKFNGDEVKQTAIYSGDVVVDQGSIRLTGDRLTLRITAKGYRQATINGNLAKFRQQRDPDPKNPVDEWVFANARQIVYDEETDTITLTGAARLSRTENGVEKDSTEGEKIIYDMRNARSSVDGAVTSGQRQRVTTIIAPRKNSNNTDAKPKAREGATLSSTTTLSAPQKN